MYKHAIRNHSDIFTVPMELAKLRKEYEAIGYVVKAEIPIAFWFDLDDGTTISVSWENGCFYEQIC